jgi:translocator protein
MSYADKPKPSETSDIVRQAANIAAYSFTLFFNAFSQALPLNNQSNAVIANSYPIYFLPANFTFSIWGVIYTMLLGWVIYQALPSQRTNPIHRQVGYWFVIASLGNIGWLTLFHYNQFFLSNLPIIGLWFALLMVHLRTGVGVRRVSRADHLFVHLPMSVYFGWLSVAVIANITFWLYTAGWNDPLQGQIATYVMLAVAAAVGIAMVFIRNTPAFAAVVIWACYGIYSRQIAPQEGLGSYIAPELANPVAYFAVGMAVVIALSIVAWAALRMPAVNNAQREASVSAA